ncbi:hypothetical protein K7432_011836 [Basidiobolus ranarum]|uniref:Uncharacterized protein n=1 Tax=Basidiobolus ranarum TaxID=34480 RepID=A0ABR2WLQ7_9FUNG
MSTPSFYQNVYAETSDTHQTRTMANSEAAHVSQTHTMPTAQHSQQTAAMNYVELNLSPDTVDNFSTTNNGKLLWFATPPLVIDTVEKPQHSLEYMYHKLSQRKLKVANPTPQNKPTHN